MTQGNGLEGKICLVVGGGQGIGLACAQKFASEGGRVIIGDLETSQAQEAAKQLPRTNLKHEGVKVDISEVESIRSMIERIESSHGRIDILLNSAAVLEMASFLETSVESWDRTFAVNCRGTFVLAQAVARSMISNSVGGRIILVASNVGRTPRMFETAYAVTKAAVIHLARCMALEISSYGITVNALCPGSTSTGMLLDVQAGSDPERIQGIIHGSIEQWRTGIPLGRLAEPEDQANAALFLASDAGRFVNGQALCVDGGQTLF